MGIAKTIFLHTLGSIYEIGIGRSFTQRVLLPALLRKVKGAKHYPTAAEAARLNSQALRSI